MINMKVGDYRLTSDPNQVIVSRVRKDEKGDIIMVNPKKGKTMLTDQWVEATTLVGYYSNLSKAFIGVQRDYVLSGSGVDIQTIQDYQQAIQDITELFEEQVNLGEEF